MRPCTFQVEGGLEEWQQNLSQDPLERILAIAAGCQTLCRLG